ncbi:DUF4241 domain-containing protein [Pseudoclavibacter sp. 13-3]|uniref:DUF4241 domain-containing protein n=1 Tax=Pseudoclavibacter sp. 13-3 TaxID=2901228 RepID=UPI001E418463|nr:DUF4241 domain-containing protein [Pseudoclavibacter sp. 13-3]MCD7100543.1 DUF4241 domain-containing protein [Pseudoclavibacter sp. 13-3]
MVRSPAAVVTRVLGEGFAGDGRLAAGHGTRMVAGRFAVPAGQGLCVCDVLADVHAPEVEADLAAGDYVVHVVGGSVPAVAVAVHENATIDELVWEDALTSEKVPVGVSVDAGVIGFGTVAAVRALQADTDLVEAVIDSSTTDDFGTLVTTTPHGHVVSLTAGYGDGVYPLFVGRDSTGTATAVAVDFGTARTIGNILYR